MIVINEAKKLAVELRDKADKLNSQVNKTKKSEKICCNFQPVSAKQNSCVTKFGYVQNKVGKLLFSPSNSISK